MIIDIFGWRNHAMQHYRHLMYWMPKLAHANPFPVLLRIVDELDENPIYLAHLIAERISPDRMTKFQLIQVFPRFVRLCDCLGIMNPDTVLHDNTLPFKMDFFHRFFDETTPKSPRVVWSIAINLTLTELSAD